MIRFCPLRSYSIMSHGGHIFQEKTGQISATLPPDDWSDVCCPEGIGYEKKGGAHIGWAFMVEGMICRITISGTCVDVLTLISKFAFFPVEPR